MTNKILFRLLKIEINLAFPLKVARDLLDRCHNLFTTCFNVQEALKVRERLLRSGPETGRRGFAVK